MTIVRPCKINAPSWRTIDPRVFRTGDLVPVLLKNGEMVQFRVMHDSFDKVYFVLEDCLRDTYFMNPTSTNKGGYFESTMRNYLNTIILRWLPDELQDRITPTRIVQIINGKQVEHWDKLFLLSATQVFGIDSVWSEMEPADTQLDWFKKERNRIKERDEYGTVSWWLRSAHNASNFRYVSHSGTASYYNATNTYGVAFGFMIKDLV